MIRRIYHDLGKGWFTGAIIFGLFCSSILFWGVPLDSFNDYRLLKVLWVAITILGGLVGFGLVVSNKICSKYGE